MDGTLRFCTGCQQEKTVQQFSFQIKDRGIRQTRCKDCCRVASKVWQQKNKDAKNQSWLKWVSENKEQFKATQKKYRDCHKSERAIRSKEYGALNKSKIELYSRAYYETHKEKHLACVLRWRRKNPEAWKVNQANYRARKNNAAGQHSADDIRRILRAQHARCAYCSINVKNKYHVDHIQPLSRGGSNSASNLQILCATCNTRKAAKEPILFARGLGLLL